MKSIIRGLSLTRPWSFAFVNGPQPEQKRVENRSKRPPEKYIGAYIALHSAQSWDEEDREFIQRVTGLYVPSKKESPHSEIFAVCKLVGYVEQEYDARLSEAQRKWFFGEFGWLFEDLVKLPEPVPCKGELGLWGFDTRPGVLEAVRKQYRAATGALIE